MKLIFIISVFVLIAAFSNAESPKKENIVMFADTNATCPVTGDDISGEHLVFRYIDKDIKFCNEGCVMAFKKEPAKYSEHLLCMPCNDPDGKHDINAVHSGVKYYFCSSGCKGKFEKEPESYLKNYMK